MIGSEKIDIDDASLDQHRRVIEDRHDYMANYISTITCSQSVIDFASAYKTMGFYRDKGKPGVAFREWAPNALSMNLTGDFNNWNHDALKCTRMENDIFDCFVADESENAICHLSKVKIVITVKDSMNGKTKKIFRVPSHIRYAIPDPIDKNSYVGVYWDYTKYTAEFSVKSRMQPKLIDASGLRIYECHIGMAGEDEGVSTYSYFEHSILPRVVAGGYNCIQMMAIVEHAYYASFGYHCNMFYAVSSRFGSPTDFKRLVDAIHNAGLYLVIDIIQSHASPNVEDGLNQFDGSSHQYFAEGEAGEHRLWGSKCFDYSKKEVIQFLLGQLMCSVEEYGVDGFRFDGVTSMLYTDHAISRGFNGDYMDYFGFNSRINIDAISYLSMANLLLHSLSPPAFSIAEDVSGYPQLASPFKKGGIGFDFRMNMAIADMWIKLLKESRFEDWDVGNIIHTITNRRYTERYISYNECHDQSLVGDKTLAFWLMDSHMYSNMSINSNRDTIISNGIAALHIIRLITKALGGEGYLNFMGNEFGHPEWIDFPREGNLNSYKYCRRQWHLVDDKNLLYQYIQNWDADTNNLCSHFRIQVNGFEYITLRDVTNQIVAFEKGDLLFVFSFNCHTSFSDYNVPVRNKGSYRCILTASIYNSN